MTYEIQYYQNQKLYTVSVLHKNSQSPLSNKQTSRSLQIKNAWPLHSKNKQNNQKNKNSVQQIFSNFWENKNKIRMDNFVDILDDIVSTGGFAVAEFLSMTY